MQFVTQKKQINNKCIGGILEMINTYFDENMNLLEQMKINNLFSLYDQESINEASIAGMKITKENLQDEKFVRELMKKIDEKEEKSESTSKMVMALGIISSLTVIGIPIGLLLLMISGSIIKHGSSKENLKKLEECIDTIIGKLNKQKSKEKNENKKNEYSSVIEKLQNTKKIIHEGEAFVSLSDIDKSKYKDGNIKINNKCSVRSIAGDYLCEREPICFTAKEVKAFKKDIEDMKKVKTTSCLSDNIELLAMNNITTKSDLLKYIDNMDDTHNSEIQRIIKDYGDKSNRLLKGKNLAIVYQEQDYLAIIYSYDNDCCYYWPWDYSDIIEKISTSDFLKASKTAYEDLMKIYKQL